MDFQNAHVWLRTLLAVSISSALIFTLHIFPGVRRLQGTDTRAVRVPAVRRVRLLLGRVRRQARPGQPQRGRAREKVRKRHRGLAPRQQDHHRCREGREDVRMGWAC